MAQTKIIIAFILLMVVAGCGSFQSGKDKPPVAAAFTATGTEGLVLKFAVDQPPAKVYTGGPISFLVEVRNRGTYQVPSAMFYLSGFDQIMLPIIPNPIPLTTPLEGKTQYNPEGGYSSFMMEASNVVLPPEMPNYKPNILITACYPYKTYATPMVCVDPNPQDTISDKACRVEKVTGTGSQGAPVAVQSIESQATPRGMFFRINIANTGGAAVAGGASSGGIAFDSNALGACPGNLKYADLNKLKYMVTLGSGEPIDCQPINNEVRLVENKATIFCQAAKSLQSLPYQTPLKVELVYGYKNSVAKMIEIENLDFGRR